MWTQLRAGTTALGDLGSANTSDALAQAALDLGMRIRVSRWGSDIMIPAHAREFKKIADTREQANDWLALMETWNDHPSGLIGSMPEALRAAHLSHNEANNDNTTCPLTLALRTGPIYGAKALGWRDKIGSIETGKQADLVLINCDDWRYQLGNHPLRTFLVTGSSADVDAVIFAGKILVQQGRSTEFNEQELLKDYRRAVASARQRIRRPG